ncbi:hypothetical protein SCANM63S_06366 [Streptomyces canarius]
MGSAWAAMDAPTLRVTSEGLVLDKHHGGLASDSVFGRMAGRFDRADLRWRMRDYVRGLLERAARKNGRHLAEWAGRRTSDGFQRLLDSSVWDVDALRDDVREYVAERLGPDGVLIVDAGFVKKGTTSAGVGRQYTGTSGACISITACSGSSWDGGPCLCVLRSPPCGPVRSMSVVIGSTWPARPQQPATAGSLWWLRPPGPVFPPIRAMSPSWPGIRCSSTHRGECDSGNDPSEQASCHCLGAGVVTKYD